MNKFDLILGVVLLIIIKMLTCQSAELTTRRSIVVGVDS